MEKFLLSSVKENLLAVYIHWPFCRSICPYCHFNRVLNKAIDEEQWSQAFVQEIDGWYRRFQDLNLKISSVFFGGGTPSLMPIQVLKSILNQLNQRFGFQKDVEITLEMNPWDHHRLEEFLNQGINRISLGIQSFDEEVLKFLGRDHDEATIVESLKHVQRSGVSYSFDLIYGHRYHEDVHRWKKDLEKAVSWVGHHASLYELSYEEATPFYQKRNQQLSDEKFKILQNLHESAMQDCGLQRYEISNYAHPGWQSQHNLTYWRYGRFLGLGPGAHGRIHQNGTHYAFHNIPNLHRWLSGVLQTSSEQGEIGGGIWRQSILNSESVFQEKLMMGLRLVEGVSWEHLFNDHFPSSGFLQRFYHLVQADYIQIKYMPTDFMIKLKNSLQTFSKDPKIWKMEMQHFWQEYRQERWALNEKGMNVMNSLIHYLFQEKDIFAP